ncbi:hypothetical protein HPB47_009687 [Ixodes persulcatus]|uniref:Uncharacterized protein n=1 Tax=Ixodes persulcatus TaxID=34615 RepID=A0AC60P175_IXOPE|nr:hypothetical protein HPB47_009687 [Ixodes persulcatus]
MPPSRQGLHPFSSDIITSGPTQRRLESVSVPASASCGVVSHTAKPRRMRLPLYVVSWSFSVFAARGKAEEELEELAESLQLPLEALQLRESADLAQPEVTVYARAMLRGGTLFGPYPAMLVPQHLEHHVAIQPRDGHPGVNLRLKQAAGTWLKMLRLVRRREEANASLSLEGDEVWCNLTRDVSADTELLAHVNLPSSDVAASGGPPSATSQEPSSLNTPPGGEPPPCEERAAAASTTSDTDPSKEPSSEEADKPPATDGAGKSVAPVPAAGLPLKYEQVNGFNPLANAVQAVVLEHPLTLLQTQAFKCVMCGIQFSSIKTLRAHQTYYCTKRLDKLLVPSVQHDTAEDSSGGGVSSPRPHEGSPEDSAAPAKRPRREDSSPLSSDASSTPSKSPKAGRCYQCPYCSYAYDRKGSLTRHMRLHGSPPSPPSADPVGTEDVSMPPGARYCSNCDIQFSSYKTFTVHKQYYCSTRHVQKSAAAAAASVVSAPQQGPEHVLLNQPLFAAISTNPLILVPCSYVPGNGLVPTSATSAITPAIVCQQPVTTTAPIVPEVAKENGARPREADLQATEQPSVERESPSMKQEEPASETPLDLRLRKDVEASPRSSPTPGTSGEMPALVVGGLDPLGDQVVVKQGTSRCRECNIVFYKHANYLAHKRHYCASRQQKLGRLSSPSGDEGSSSELASRSPANATVSPTVDAFPQRSATVQSPQPMYQFYCLACGIKFTSLSNLQAHQTYYCPKRDVLKGQVGVAAVTRPAEFACPRCRLSYPSDEALKQHLCAAALRKCPYCDVFCPTQIAAQRHLVTHTGVRAFRCAACGYKGHTLRGMRTHVRVHLDKGTQLQEEALILCVGADGSTVCPWNGASANPMPIAPKSPVDTVQEKAKEGGQPSARSASPPTASSAAEESVVSRAAAIEDQGPPSSELLHWCNLCGYSSSYKGNVVRHVKLVHRDVVAASAVQSFTSERPRTVDERRSPAPPSDIKTEQVSDAEDVSVSQDHEQEEGGVEDPRRAESPVVTEANCNVSAAESSPPPMGGDAAKPPQLQGAKYCKSCDISFNYLSTFIAHKKYYCSSQAAPNPGGEVRLVEEGST